MAFGKLRDLKKESLWRRMVQRQAASDLSVRSWCEKHGLREAGFYWWRKELSRRDAEAARGGVFVPLRVVEDESSVSDHTIEIMVAGQRRVRVIGRVDRQLLADVLCVLEGRAC